MGAATVSMLVLSCLLQAKPADDEAAIQAIFKERAHAFAKRDVAELVSHFDADADSIDSTGVLVRGRDAIRKRYQEFLTSTEFKHAQFIQEVTQIQVHGDVAIVDGDFRIFGLRDAEGKETADRSGHSTVVLVRRNGEWLIVALRGYRRGK